jgi:tyrosinase
MLHSNVDRLWALWQWTIGRTDPDDADAYSGQDFDGRRLDDTLWPWNGVTDPPRPDFAPGGTLAPSPAAAAPGPEPTLRSMIDFQGRTNPPDRLGYGYDTVPFERG